MSKLLSIENINYTVPYGDTILENVNLEVEPGEFIGLLGHNGSGKSTLIDLLLGNRSYTSGKISILDEDPHSADRKNKRDIVYLSQDVSIKGDVTISEFLKFHSAFYKNYSRDLQNHLLKVFDLNPNQKVGVLSTGQQKKVQVVAGLSTQPKLIIIDEITAVMDPETRDIFFRELLKVKSQIGSSILLATNIAEDLVNRADKVLFIENKTGKLHHPDEIMKLFNIESAA